MSGNEMRDLIKALKDMQKALNENTRLQKAVVGRLETMERDRKKAVSEPYCSSGACKTSSDHWHGPDCSENCQCGFGAPIDVRPARELNEYISGYLGPGDKENNE